MAFWEQLNPYEDADQTNEGLNSKEWLNFSDQPADADAVKNLFRDAEWMSPDDYASNELLKDELNEVLLELTDREEKVLRLRFGLDDGRTRTLEEVGKEFNVTRERIRQIEAKALRKLKHPSRSKRLKDFLDK